MYRLNHEIFYYDEADNIGVAINFTNGYCYTMNRIATTILRELMNGADAEQLIVFFETIDGCPKEFRKNVLAYIDQLCQYGILVKSDTGNETTPAISPLTEAEVSEGFDIEIDEFRDAQDLILADPVHDVDPNLGWPELK